ncbi:MAG: hypothetical protein L7F78_17965 [Syntrophales bacterium LBB04]|nr:hypothetical protein [Syntrophales bacterium LBB04]
MIRFTYGLCRNKIRLEALFTGNGLTYPYTSQLGIKTIFIDSNQGAKSHDNVTPDYFAARFEDVLERATALT